MPTNHNINSSTNGFKSISSLLNALNDKDRYAILNVLCPSTEDSLSDEDYMDNYAKDVKEIKYKLKEKFSIELSEKEVEEHVAKLRDVNILGKLKTNAHRDRLPRSTYFYRYYINEGAFTELFLALLHITH